MQSADDSNLRISAFICGFFFPFFMLFCSNSWILRTPDEQELIPTGTKVQEM